jgi:flagellar export protein FliJ
MERFRFSLARVLDWRRQQQQCEEEALAALLAERHALDQARQDVDREASRLRAEPREDGSHLAAELAAAAGYRQVLRRKAAQLLRESEQCAARIAAQRARLLEARRRVRLLERLEAAQRRQWETALSREQETLATDLYLARWRRPPASGGKA